MKKIGMCCCCGGCYPVSKTIIVDGNEYFIEHAEMLGLTGDDE